MALWTKGKIQANALVVGGASTLNGTASVAYLSLQGTGTDPVLYGNTQTIVVQNPLTAKPTADRGVAFTLISNSTGVAMCVNTTGTTWKYLNVTAIQPT